MRNLPGMGNLSMARVRYVLRKAETRSMDSRRLWEVHEMMVELLAIGRELLREKQRQSVASRVRQIEREGLAMKIGAAIDATPPSAKGTHP